MPITSPEPAPADAGADDPIDVATIRTTVERALTQGPLPRREDLVEAELLLRGHIQLLLPIAESKVEALAVGTVEYVGQRQALNIARYRVGRGLGPIRPPRTPMSGSSRTTAARCSATPRPAGDDDGTDLPPVRDVRPSGATRAPMRRPVGMPELPSSPADAPMDPGLGAAPHPTTEVPLVRRAAVEQLLLVLAVAAGLVPLLIYAGPHN